MRVVQCSYLRIEIERADDRKVGGLFSITRRLLPWPSAIRLLACQLGLSESPECCSARDEKIPCVLAIAVPQQHPVTQPCNLNGASGLTFTPVCDNWFCLLHVPWPHKKARWRAKVKNPASLECYWPSLVCEKKWQLLLLRSVSSERNKTTFTQKTNKAFLLCSGEMQPLDDTKR